MHGIECKSGRKKELSNKIASILCLGELGGSNDFEEDKIWKPNAEAEGKTKLGRDRPQFKKAEPQVFPKNGKSVSKRKGPVIADNFGSYGGQNNLAEHRGGWR